MIECGIAAHEEKWAAEREAMIERGLEEEQADAFAATFDRLLHEADEAAAHFPPPPPLPIEPMRAPSPVAQSGMRRVVWSDMQGRRWTSLIPEAWDEAMAEQGIPVGPVSLETMGLPLAWEVALHNALHDRNLLTYRDVLQRPGDVAQALRAVWKRGATEVIDIFRDAATTA